MNQFIYNEHGACMNPILKTFKCGKGYEAQVEVAIMKNNLWDRGVRVNGFEEGWSHTINQYRKESALYKSKDEAFKAGVELLLYQLQSRNNLERYKRIIAILKEELTPIVENQLSLF